MMRPSAASESEVTEVVAAVRLKRCSLYLVPPNTIERPSTNSTLPMIDPVMEAFTTLVRPLERAMPAIISSAAFPKVALSNPPRPSPTRAERFAGAPDPARDRNDAESGANEERSRTDASGPEAQKDRERNKDKKPVEGRFDFQKSGNFATCFS